MQSNELLTQRLRRQIDVSGPKQKRLWQQIVRAKIAAQAVNLKIASGPTDGEAEKLRSLIPKVASGDPANIEGQAARIYWPALFGKSFRREQGGAWPNPFLNYGYMVMRAALARAIAGADLHPSSGIHHHNRGNAFCLADDLVEPLRPLVDAAVFGALAERAAAGDPVLSPGNKRMTLELLARDVELGGQSGPLMVQLHRMAAGLWECYSTDRDAIDLPTYNTTTLLAGVAKADD